MEAEGFDITRLGALTRGGIEVRTDASGRFECGGLMPGVYQPALDAIWRWNEKGGLDNWPGATTERVVVEATDSVVSDLALQLKESAQIPQATSGGNANFSDVNYMYDPTNGAINGEWRVKQ